MGILDAKPCPNCGSALRPVAIPRSLTAVRLLAVDLLLWATVTLFLAYLWSPRADGELYAALGSAGLVVWALLRSRQRADSLELAEHGQYRCEQCDRYFEGGELREIPPPQ